MTTCVRAAIVAGVVLAASSLVGCTTPVPSPEESTSDDIAYEISQEQADAIADRDIDADEYEAGFQRYRACMVAAGFDLMTSGSENETIRYSVPDAAVQSGDDARCYNTEFQQIDMLWQLAHEDTSYSAQVLKDCLAEHGITPEDTMEELVQQLRDAGLTAAECNQ